jgi:hypothetical protein
MSSEGCAAHPVGYNSPASDSYGHLAHFFKIWTYWYNACLALFKLKKKSAPTDHYYLQWAATPDQITQQNRIQRAVKAL